MQTIRELVTKWGFQVEHEPLEKIEKSLEGIKSRLEFLAAAEVLKGVVELTEKFAHFAEELHIAAVSAGITVEAFQKLAFAAGHSSVSQEEMAGSMARLSRMLYQAREGSEHAQLAFQQVGFTPEQVRGFHSGSDAMLALADRFKNIQDPIQKQALAMQLLGRGSVNMVGFLSQGSAAIKGMGVEAEHLGIVLSEHQIEALTKVEHAMSDLWAVFKAVGATIASYFAPSIETAIKDFLKFYEINRKLIDTNIRAWVWDITYALGFVYEAVKFVVQKFFDFAASHQTLTRRAIEFAVALGVLVGIIWTTQRVIGVLTGAVDLLKLALSPLTFLWEKAFAPGLFWIGNLIRLGLSKLFLSLATLTEAALPALSEAFLAMGAAIEATPVGWLITGIAALVVILHDAWTLLSGGKWEDTWIAKAIGAAKGFGSKALSFLGLGGNDQESTQSAAGKLSAMQELSETPSLGGGTNGFAAGMSSAMNYQVNAPITLNLEGNHDPKAMGQKVKEGIAEHLDKVYRRTQQSLAPSQAY